MCWSWFKTKTFSNCQATFQIELCLLFEESDNFFHKANVQVGLTPLLSVCFCLVFTDSTPPLLHDERTF